MVEQSDVFYLDGKPGRTAVVKGRELLFFSGYNYLGVSHHPDFVDLVAEGSSRFGWLFSSSRISNTRLALFEECEALLSRKTGSEDTVLLPSGFTAGQLATSVYGPDLLNAPGSHPAISQNKPFHNDFEAWSQWLINEARDPMREKPLSFASDSLSPLTAKLYDFSFISGITRPVNAIIDDSHGIGIIGAAGNGISSMLPENENSRYTITYSLSKAFGISGGAVSCDQREAERLRALPEYTAVSPLSPGLIHAFIKGQDIYEARRLQLQHNIRRFTELTSDLPGVAFHPQFPVFVLPSCLDERTLEKNGILISAFSYPTPSAPKIKRVVVNALHTDEDLETLAQVLRQTSVEAGAI